MSLDPMPDTETLMRMKAERERRGNTPGIFRVPAAPAEQLVADDARDEKRVVAACDKQLRALGFRVINTSQPRHAKFITPGVPDRFYFHRARGVAFAWEAKTATGTQSPAQRDFQDDCDACGWTYLVGTDQVVYDWLVAQGIAFEEGGLLVALPYTARRETA